MLNQPVVHCCNAFAVGMRDAAQNKKIAAQPGGICGNAQRWHLDSLTVANASGDWKGIHWTALSDHLPVVAELRLIEQ